MPNSITNTLFRFTSLRSPELLSDEAKALYFVQHPNPTEQGHFADVVNQNYGSKEEWLETFRTRAEEFSTIQTADELRDFIGEDIYSFATCSEVPTLHPHHQRSHTNYDAGIEKCRSPHVNVSVTLL